MRRAYLDNIRWTTQILAVLCHVLFLYSAIESEPGLDAVPGHKAHPGAPLVRTGDEGANVERTASQQQVFETFA